MFVFRQYLGPSDSCHSYRIHLSPGSRRNSARSAISRVLNTPAQPKKEESPPPALEPARVYTTHSPPPDSPPPLAHATLPATTTNGSYYETTSNGNNGYSYVHSNPTPSPPFSGHSLQHHQTQQQQQLSPIQSPHALAHQPSLSHQSSQHLSQHSLPPPPQLTHSHSHYETSSRHSIAHISPPSPDSSSGPPTPYQAYSQDGYARYDSPPPVLAPLRGVERGYYYGGSNAEWAPRGKGMVQ